MRHRPPTARTTAQRLRLPPLLCCVLALLACALPQRLNADGLFGLVGVPSVDIEGYGWLGSLYLENTLKVLSTSEEQPEPQINAVFIEDALWIISGQLQQQGYLYPSIRVRVSDAQGQSIYEGDWSGQELTPHLPTGLEGAHVLFSINPGVLFYFESIQVEGLPADFTAKPASFFYATDQLFSFKSTRFYNRSRSSNGVQGILANLRGMGYRDAAVAEQKADINRESGAVSFFARIEHGPVYYVDELVIEPGALAIASQVLSGIPLSVRPDAPTRLTPEWLQQRTQSVRNRYYTHGYPEVRLTLRFEDAEAPRSTEVSISTAIDPLTPPAVAPSQPLMEAQSLVEAQPLMDAQLLVETQPLMDAQSLRAADATHDKSAASAAQVLLAQDIKDALDPAHDGDLQPVAAQDAATRFPTSAQQASTTPDNHAPAAPAQFSTGQGAPTASQVAHSTIIPRPSELATGGSRTSSAQAESAQNRRQRVIIQVQSGPKVKIGTVGFSGEYGTNMSVLESQLTVHPGEELDRNSVENTRNKLNALGIFRSVEIEYTEVDENTWDVTYQMQMKQRTEVSLILGAGTFDIIRGGFLIEQNNLFGLAHSQRLRAVQSFKATDIAYRYGIPQLFGNDIDFYAKGNFLHRKEISFNRQEYGAATGLQHYYRPLRTTFDVQYSLEQLSARNRNFVVAPGPTQATVSAIGLKAAHNGLDNPIFPTKGWQAHASVEFAISDLGGDVDYQRFDMAVSWHTPLNDMGLIFHTGLRHGVITTTGTASQQIPVNRRFFMGGENTVRGYRRDQAAPRDSAGNQIGAVSYLLWQVELEQRLTEDLSLVTFLDALGNAADISNYPFNETVASVGIGLNYRTFVGPVRLEYGHNVKKRPGDPSGTVQFSIGFPF